MIEDVLYAFSTQRSLSNKGTPYDNAVAEALFKVFKTELVRKKSLPDLLSLQSGLMDYIHWFNTIRIHGTLGYLTPLDYKTRHLIIDSVNQMKSIHSMCRLCVYSKSA